MLVPLHVYTPTGQLDRAPTLVHLDGLPGGPWRLLAQSIDDRLKRYCSLAPRHGTHDGWALSWRVLPCQIDLVATRRSVTLQLEVYLVHQGQVMALPGFGGTLPVDERETLTLATALATLSLAPDAPWPFWHIHARDALDCARASARACVVDVRSHLVWDGETATFCDDADDDDLERLCVLRLGVQSTARPAVLFAPAAQPCVRPGDVVFLDTDGGADGYVVASIEGASARRSFAQSFGYAGCADPRT